MSWCLLMIAGLMEIVWAIGLKYSNGFTHFIPSMLTIFFIMGSFILFSKSVKTIPIGTAYAVFTGIGAAGTAIIGSLFLHEGFSAMKGLCLVVLLSGILGLKLIEGKEEEKARGLG
jgi:quaternary ammonium compound-resistance protein SugE